MARITAKNTLRSLAYMAAAGTAAHGVALPSPTAVEQTSLRAWSFHHENVLGTSMDVTVRAANHADAIRAESAVLQQIDTQSRILSAWDKNSELSRWLQTRNTAETVSPTLLQVLALFDQWRGQTNGALDASAETAVQLWQRATQAGRTPTDVEIRHAVAAMQQQHWSLDLQNYTATRTSGAPLALATFAKSYIASHAADAALQAGAAGVMLNIGGDIVTRGHLTQVVDVADPGNDTENSASLDQVSVQNLAVATSGSYRRGFDLADSITAPAYSHIIDPRTALPTAHILSSTVIAKDPTTAGALATAFSVLTPAESMTLAEQHPDVAYLLVTAEGKRIESANWHQYQTESITPAAYVITPHTGAPAATKAANWQQGYELLIQLELARVENPRYRRPYVAVWIEDKDHYPIRTVALWFDGKTRYLPELKSWYRDDQVRSMAEGTDITRTVTSATRAPGKYTLKWDGKDDAGKLVHAGSYTVCVEISREHGSYEILRYEMNFNGTPQQKQLGTGTEGSATIVYRKQ